MQFKEQWESSTGSVHIWHVGRPRFDRKESGIQWWLYVGQRRRREQVSPDGEMERSPDASQVKRSMGQGCERHDVRRLSFLFLFYVLFITLMLRGYSWLHTGTTSGSFQWTMWNAGDWTWVGHMQGKCPTYWTIIPVLISGNTEQVTWPFWVPTAPHVR